MVRRLLFLMLLALLLYSGNAWADKFEIKLSRNPFLKPYVEEVENSHREKIQATNIVLTDRSLRATLSSGEYSIANIDGSMVSIGEKIKGYELIEVGEGSATLTKNGKAITLNVSEMHKKLK